MPGNRPGEGTPERTGIRPHQKHKPRLRQGTPRLPRHSAREAPKGITCGQEAERKRTSAGAAFREQNTSSHYGQRNPGCHWHRGFFCPAIIKETLIYSSRLSGPGGEK